MHRSDDAGSALEARLRDAELSLDAYDDPAAARERIARLLAEPGTPLGGDRPAAPAPHPFEHEQARHELDLACALVINMPQAAACLARLADDHRIDSDGALVFGCLLHIAEHGEAARFWWQFAAGGGSHTAAYCVYLYHRRHAEFRDAEYWRAQAAHLAAHARPRPPERAADRDPLLPREVRHALIAQCHHGRPPHLPPAIAEVVDRLQAAADDETDKADEADEDSPPVPRPPLGLARRLSRRAPHTDPAGRSGRQPSGGLGPVAG